MAYAICQIFEQKKLMYSVFLKSKNEFRLRYMWFLAGASYSAIFLWFRPYKIIIMNNSLLGLGDKRKGESN